MADESGGVLKYRFAGRRAPRTKGPMSKKQVFIQNDVVDKVGFMMEPASRVSGGKKRVAVSTPNPLGIPNGASDSKTKTGGTYELSPVRNQPQVMVDMEVEEVEGSLFVDEKGRRKLVGEEESDSYRNGANDYELIDRKFCESYEHLLGTIKCSMEKCREPGCVLNVFTKGYNFKSTTVTTCRGSVKGTKCGKSVTFGTCLQQWFGLGILDDNSRQPKARETAGAVPPLCSLTRRGCARNRKVGTIGP